MNNNMEREVYEIDLDDIIPNRFQPRLTFDEEALKELTASIKEHGVIQPLVLRRLGNKYEIIAGERRYKASTLAGLKKVPAIIMNLDDNESAEVAIIENIQRKQLNSLEEAKSIQQLLDRGYTTQEELAKSLGKSQSGISNKMRLLNLCEDVQEALLANKISERHARSLLTLKTEEQQVSMLNKILKERLTVRQTDAAIKEMRENSKIVVEEGEKNMNPDFPNPFNNINIANDIPVEPITPLFPTSNQQQETIASTIGNNVINVNNKNNEIPKFNFGDIEELNMDIDFQEIDEPQFKTPVQQINKEPMPVFNPNLNQPLQTQQRDIRPIISDIRQTVNNIQREGFVVDLEEFDYGETYQFIIKIQKN